MKKCVFRAFGCRRLLTFSLRAKNDYRVSRKSNTRDGEAAGVREHADVHKQFFLAWAREYRFRIMIIVRSVFFTFRETRNYFLERLSRGAILAKINRFRGEYGVFLSQPQTIFLVCEQ